MSISHRGLCIYYKGSNIDYDSALLEGCLSKNYQKVTITKDMISPAQYSKDFICQSIKKCKYVIIHGYYINYDCKSVHTT